MQKAKQAVADFVSRDGKHKTTVEEDVRREITEEHVMPHRHENVTTAIDKEVHQDHHHTTVQPIMAKETLAEKHTHNIVPVEHKSFEHGNDKDVRAKLDADAAQYRDTSTTHDTTHSSSVNPVVAGERIHHHVHEHVQPVIQKEVIAPQVVHTTIPIHETHHAAAQFHGTSVLPPKTLEELNSNKAGLDGKGHSKVEYDGCPKSYNKDLQVEQGEGDRDMHAHSGGLGGVLSGARKHKHTGSADSGVGVSHDTTGLRSDKAGLKNEAALRENASQRV
ncbi:hypothetical protein HYQ45_000603 [Verticillium longisporum]|uniref:Allergen n=2 Tax=Verticillium TaxID=1036719 RepID=A0A8I3A1V6_VERLO|nr:DNA topoisomerase 2 [Verticillium dahliae VDG1]KAG7143136.1 hypothetical protein HYQ45_000603 [Verticillium longisporum]PNH43337.1 hypothetical protein VD0004_g4099 [Verticillium dahliae]PNH76167.1 hypothetical protein VD0001_g1379 [Verticillium dahliae]RBQ84182.1 hypothetical protein VDGD_03881 [Verticillium dahliae]